MKFLRPLEKSFPEYVFLNGEQANQRQPISPRLYDINFCKKGFKPKVSTSFPNDRRTLVSFAL
jgi:hypothetical protein